MKASLVGTIFLFASISGFNVVKRKDSLLIQKVIPCIKDTECQQRLGPKSQCMNNICICFEDGQLKECPFNVAEVIVSQGTQGRSYNAELYMGKRCNSNSDCPYAYAVCNNTQQCSCAFGFVGSADNRFCIPAAQNLDDSCHEKAQCTYKFPNSTCSNSRKCECLENYHQTDDQCWKNIGYEEKCGDSRECSHIQGYCNETKKVCLCEGKRVINNRRTMCLDIVGNKERCFQTIQCKEGLGEAECIEGYCYCSKGYHFSETKRKCLPSKTLGQLCDGEEECYQTSSSDDRNFLTCTSTKICTCATGFEKIGNECEKTDGGSSAVGPYSTTVFLLVTCLLFLL